MAISDSQKVDYLWKKLGYSAAKTDTNAIKKAPNEAISSPLLMRIDTLWSQSGTIPSVLPGSSTGVVTVYPTSNPIECTEDTSATANRTWKTGQTNWISPEFGSTYQVKVYIHTASDAAGATGGDQVFATGSGNDDEWFFDYQAGVLHFIGSNLPNGVSFTGKSVYISGGRYTGSVGGNFAAASLGDLYVTGTPETTLTSAVTNADIGLDPNGTGQVIITGTNAVTIPSGSTAQRPSGTLGDIRVNTSTGYLEYYDGSTWQGLSPSGNLGSLDVFTGDGSTVAFTLSASTTTTDVLVHINGVVQVATTSFSISGTTLTFTEAPKASETIEVRILSATYSAGSVISDADNDTKIQVEESADDDTIRFDTAGTERLTINASGVAAFTGDVDVQGDFTYVPRLTYWHMSGDWTVSATNSIQNWVKQTSGVYYNDTGITYSSGTFTFTEAGIYRINLQIELQGGSGEYITYQYRKNGTAYGVDFIVRQVTRTADGGSQGFVSRVMEVSANDTFDVYISSASGSGVIDATYSSLEFEKIG